VSVPSDSTPSTGERRESSRYACSWQAFCQAPENNWWRWARVFDVSSRGVLVQTNHPFENGGILDLDMEVCGFILPVRVAHVQPQPDGYWLLGCAFADGLRVPDGDLKRMLQRSPKAAEQ
jgi:hypothetical protein